MNACARMSCLIGLAGMALAAGAQPAAPAAAAAPVPRKVAIFVSNNAGAAIREKVAVLESALAGRLGSGDFQVISRGDVVQTPSDQAGALRMGQQLGADFVLVAAINRQN